MNQLELVILQALEGLRTPSEYRRDQSNGNKQCSYLGRIKRERTPSSRVRKDCKGGEEEP